MTPFVFVGYKQKLKRNISQNPIGFWSKTSGFTLVEIIVSLGIASLIGILYGGIIYQTEKTKLSLQSKMKSLSTEGLVLSNIVDDNSCNCALRGIIGQVFDSTNPAATLSIPNIHFGNFDPVTKACTGGNTGLVRGTNGGPNPVVTSTAAADITVSNFAASGNNNEFNAILRIIPTVVQGQVSQKPTPLFIRIHTTPASTATAEQIAGCGPAPLTIPAGLAALPNGLSGQCNLTWLESSGANPVYTVQTSTSAGQAGNPSSTVVCSKVPALGCTATGLTNNIKNYFAIKASNKSESTAFSGEVSCIPVVPPSPPVLSVSHNGSGQFTLTWSNPTAPSPAPSADIVYTYTVRYSDTPNQIGGFSSALAGGNVICVTGANTCTVTLAPTIHYFSVNASVFGIAGNYSAEVKKGCVSTTIVTQSLTTVSCNDHNLDVTFNLIGSTLQITAYNYNPARTIAGWNCPYPYLILGNVPLIDSSTTLPINSISYIKTLNYSLHSSGPGCATSDQPNLSWPSTTTIYASLCPTPGPQYPTFSVTVSGTLDYCL